MEFVTVVINAVAILVGCVSAPKGKNVWVRVQPEDEGLLGFADKSAISAYKAKDLYSAETLFKKVLEQSNSDNENAALSALYNLSEMYNSLNRFAEAEPLARRSYYGAEKVFGPKHGNTVLAMRNFAISVANLKRFEEAAEIQAKAMSAAKEMHGPEHLEVHFAGIDLANTLAQMELEKWTEAEGLYLHALSAVEKGLGPDHALTLLVAHQLGALYVRMEAGDKAEKYCRQAMEGRGRTLGKEDAQTLKSTDMLARALWLSGRRGNESQLAEAALLQRGTLVLTEQKRGKEDLETLRYAQFLGTVLLESGKLEEAEEVLAATLERREKVLGSDDVNTLWSVYRLGMVFQGQKRFEKAEELYRRVLDWDARCSGEPDLLEMTEDALNLLYRDNGRDSDAERVLSCRAEARRSERAEAS